MKEFYALALAAAVAFGASAEGLTLKQEIGKTPVSRSYQVTKSLNLIKEQVSPESLSALKKAPAKAGEAQTIDGDYVFTLDDSYFQTGAGVIEEDGTLEVVQEGILMIDSEYFMSEVYAAYDQATGAITFTSYELGPVQLQNGAVYYVQFEPGVFNWDTGEIDVQGYTVTYDAEKKLVQFPADHNFGWRAYTDDTYTKSAGYFDLFDVLSFDGSEPADPNIGWEDWGEAKFQDGWLLPCFGIDQTLAENQYMVKMQKSTENPGWFRLVNPYKGNCPIAEYNESEKDGFITFDVSDPDHVYFLPDDPAGFALAALGVTKFYPYNALTYYCMLYGVAPDELVEVFGEDMIYSTYKDNVLTVSSYFNESIDPETNTVIGWENDACFGIQGQVASGYGWINEDEESLNMETKIFFDASKAGVSDIISEPVTGAKEFFNLQGVRVANPAKGNVYIVRQGDKATKQYIR